MNALVNGKRTTNHHLPNSRISPQLVGTTACATVACDDHDPGRRTAFHHTNVTQKGEIDSESENSELDRLSPRPLVGWRIDGVYWYKRRHTMPTKFLANTPNSLTPV